MAPSATLDRLTRGIYLSEDPDDPSGRILYAFKQVLQTSELEKRLRANQKNGKLRAAGDALLREACEKDIFTAEECEQLQHARLAVMNAIKVDEFSREGWEILTPGFGDTE
jgi:acyl-CoA dehydrogenase